MSSQVKQKDIAAGSATNGQVLTFNSTSGEWESATPSASGSLNTAYDAGGTVSLDVSGTNDLAFDSDVADVGSDGLFRITADQGSGESSALHAPSQPVDVSFPGTNLAVTAGAGSTQATGGTTNSGSEAGTLTIGSGDGGVGSAAAVGIAAGGGGDGGEVELGTGSAGAGGAGSSDRIGGGGGDSLGLEAEVGAGGSGGASGGFGGGNGGTGGDISLTISRGGTGGAGSAGQAPGAGGNGGSFTVSASNGGNAGTLNSGTGANGGVGGDIVLTGSAGGNLSGSGSDGAPGDILVTHDSLNGSTYSIDSVSPNEWLFPGSTLFIPTFQVKRTAGGNAVTDVTSLLAPTEPNNTAFDGTTLSLASANGSAQTTTDQGTAGTEGGLLGILGGQGGAGSVSAGTAVGGAGGAAGDLALSGGQGGLGGAGSGAQTAGVGGKGSRVDIDAGRGGDGGAGTTDVSVPGALGGASGEFNLGTSAGGDGGDGTVSSAAGNGGAAGNLTIAGGVGGNAGAENSGTGGDGGDGSDITLVAGDGGAASGAGTEGTAGDVIIDAGSGNTADGTIEIGVNIAARINSGSSQTPWVHAGTVITSDEISPAQITSNTDDYAPTGIETAEVLRLNTDASRDLTGIVSSGAPYQRHKMLVNVGSFDLVLIHQLTSTATNRFLIDTGADFTLTPDNWVWLWYDNTGGVNRWRVKT